MAKTIYDVLDNGVRIGAYTAEVAERELGIPRKRVAIYAGNGTRHQGRYSFVAEDKHIPKNLIIDWKFTTGMMIRAGKGDKHGNR